jgi:flagellar biosynthesis/type III secretory pathway M-ring protein FliF/YscJ
LFSDELKSLLIQVITSWQVLAVTGVLIIYVFLVRYVARLYRRNRPLSSSPKKEKASGGEEAKDMEPSGDDDLGLEETSGEA